MDRIAQGYWRTYELLGIEKGVYKVRFVNGQVDSMSESEFGLVEFGRSLWGRVTKHEIQTLANLIERYNDQKIADHIEADSLILNSGNI